MDCLKFLKGSSMFVYRKINVNFYKEKVKNNIVNYIYFMFL